MTSQSTMPEAASAITIRRLWVSEQRLFRSHLDQLDDVSRAMRFGGAVHDSFLDAYARSAFLNGNMVYGAFARAKLLGVGEVKLLADSLPQRAEAAFSVVPHWQDKGVGDALLARIVAALQNRGIRSVSLWCRTSNHRMRHLAEKHRGKLDFMGGDETHGEVRLPWPMPSSIIEEVCGEAICYSSALWQFNWFADTAETV